MYTLMHEHITIDLSNEKNDDDCKLNLFSETLAEFKMLKTKGVSRVVDLTAVGMGRNSEYVYDVANKSGIEIIHSTGYYKKPFLPQEVYIENERKLAERMISEIVLGIDGKIKARMIGEIGTSKDRIEEEEKKVFAAASIAANETGIPLYTHTSLGTMAVEQVELLEKYGVDLSRVVIGHMDLSKDLNYIRRVLETGVNIGFDTVGKENYFPDRKRAEFISTLIQTGFVGQIVLSMDITRKSHLKANNGLGYSYIIDNFIPLLKSNGVTDEDINIMLTRNPERILNH